MRTREWALARLQREALTFFEEDEWRDLELSPAERDAFVADAAVLVGNYFDLEDPDTVSVVGTELMLETELGSTKLRGIIDRLDRKANGDLVVVDYKTGRAPSVNFENSKLGGVNFYAYLCEQLLGTRPTEVKLLHLREPVSISTVPTAQSTRAMSVRAGAIWKAVERACEREDFRPNPGRMCSWCSFQDYCPAKGGVLPEHRQPSAVSA